MPRRLVQLRKRLDDRHADARALRVGFDDDGEPERLAHLLLQCSRSQRGTLDVIFILKRHAWARFLNFEAVDANALFHSDLGWGAVLPLTICSDNVHVTPIVVRAGQKLELSLACTGGGPCDASFTFSGYERP